MSLWKAEWIPALHLCRSNRSPKPRRQKYLLVHVDKDRVMDSAFEKQLRLVKLHAMMGRNKAMEPPAPRTLCQMPSLTLLVRLTRPTWIVLPFVVTSKSSNVPINVPIL